MPPCGSTPDADEQIMVCGASFAEIQAISAKVGDAARPSQPTEPVGHEAPVSLHFVMMEVVISRLPD